MARPFSFDVPTSELIRSFRGCKKSEKRLFLWAMILAVPTVGFYEWRKGALEWD